jgi:SAM-dependent methyltransferase
VSGSKKIDIGCGSAKREGFIGLDYIAAPGVDYVLDVSNQRFPFEDASVNHVFSAHFFEHIGAPNNVLSEIGRVCEDGAKIEIVTPYAFSNDAFVYGHVTFMTELPWIHFCISHRDTYLEMLRGRWLLEAVNFVIPEHTEAEIRKRGFPLDFAVKYFKGVVEEFAVEMRFQREPNTPIVYPRKTFSRTRFAERSPLALEE